jgi:serine/threonine protein kinase
MPYNIGSYGIIVDESLSNITKPNKVYYETEPEAETENKQISKLFIDKYNFKTEYKNYLIIKKIDPKNKFTYKMINVSKYKVLLDEYYKLEHIINIKQYEKYDFLNIYEITMIKSEASLNEYLKNSTNTTMFKNNFKNQFIQLLEGIKKLHQHKFVHLDLKEYNILITNNVLYLIDFGFSNYTKELFYSKNIYVFGSTYIYFPFETKIIYDIYNKINKCNDEINIIEITTKEIIEYINNTDFIELYFNDYYKDLKKYIIDLEEVLNLDQDKIKNQIKDFINDIICKHNILSDTLLEFQICMKKIFEDIIFKIDIYSIGIILNNLSNYLPNNTQTIIPKLINMSPYNRPDIDNLILMMKR